MSRSIILSNGELAVALDQRGLVNDVYYPHVGQENHVRGHYFHRVGVWVDGRLCWLSDPSWQVTVHCEENALASAITASNQELQVELVFTDVVGNDTNVFVRRIGVTNIADRVREIKLYVAHQFELSKIYGGDTAFFDPQSHAIIHYKDRRAFLITATLDGDVFNDFATGRVDFEGHEGTHRDADDGVLSQNPIEHGPADSAIGLYATYAPKQSRTCYYSMIAARSIDEARTICLSMRTRTAAHIVSSTRNYWRAWCDTFGTAAGSLPERYAQLYRISLLFTKAAVDHDGGIIASLDSDMLQWGYDTYAYVWPRDAAYAAMMLAEIGDRSATKRFLKFCARIISPEGYFLHKFWADGAFGSSWHPWITGGKTQLPIQEDETAIVVITLERYVSLTQDLEFLEQVFETLVVRPTEFMIAYRDPFTHLPLPSYDLWERKRGTSTYTSSMVYAALVSAAHLARLIGRDDVAERYATIAEEVRNAILQYLWDEERGAFVNTVLVEDQQIAYDRTIDVSSVYGAMHYRVLSFDDERLHRAWDTTVHVLSKNIAARGLARFENDDYFRVDSHAPGNPWVLTTLWYVEYLTHRAHTTDDLKQVTDFFDWVVLHVQSSGAISEQINPITGEQVGSTPLTWAHAEFASAAQSYLKALYRIRGSM